MRTSLHKKRRRFYLMNIGKLLKPVSAIGTAALLLALFFTAVKAFLPIGAVLMYHTEQQETIEPVPKPAVLFIEEGALPDAFAILEESTPSLPEMPVILPESEIPEENKAALVYKTYTASSSNVYLPLENGFIKNCTSLPKDTLQQAVEKGRDFSIKFNGSVEVLIMHTHTTESYLPFSEGAYDTTYATRSTDNNKNMAAVGEVIAEKLREAGIGVIHDTTQHDYPSYNGSYDRSRKTVQSYLSEYPTIKVVLDIHRDAILSGDTAVAPVADIDGKTAAQLMIISGCDDGTMNFPGYLKNLGFAADLQNQLEQDHPGLTRPVLFDYRKYNQDLTSGSLLVEVGSHGNTLEQALYSAALLGESLGRLLKGIT